MSDAGEKTEEYERFLYLKEGLTPLKSYVIDSGASNHMVSSKEFFITFPLSGGPSSHMGDESKILAIEKGSDKIQHVYFNNGRYVPSPTKK